MNRKYIIVADDSISGFDEEIAKLEREWGAEEIEPSADCISREEVRRILGNEVFELMKLHTVNPEDNPKADAMAYGVNWSLNTLMELPSVTPQRPNGKWIHWTDDYKDYCTCSECGYGEEGELFLKNITPFCPYCGSYNGGEEDEDRKSL